MTDVDFKIPENYIYQSVLNQIISKQLFPGSRIVEEQLAQEMGVSRTPIRAALKRLSYEGLVTIVPHKGAVVATPTCSGMEDAYTCKQLLEAEAIRLAARQIGQEELCRLEELVEEEIRSHQSRDFSHFIQINQEFHQILAHASGNLYFEKYIMELHHACDVYLIFYDKFGITAPEESETLKDHRAIVEACRNRDEEAAVAAINKHNRATLDALQNP